LEDTIRDVLVDLLNIYIQHSISRVLRYEFPLEISETIFFHEANELVIPVGFRFINEYVRHLLAELVEKFNVVS